MVTKKKALGRGLDALIGNKKPSPTASSPRSSSAEAAGDLRLRELPLDLIHPGRYQPRSVFDQEKLEELAQSIRAQGVVQPVVVHDDGSGRYELIAGERRWRAAQLAGLDKIPAVIRQVEDEVILPMALIENIQREDLNPLEQAQAMKRLIDEFGLTHQETAEAVGRSRSQVSNLLRLLGLHSAVKELIDQGELDMGHARALLALDHRQQPAAAKKIANGKLSVRQAENLVRQLLAPPSRQAKPRPNADIQRLENSLTETLGARVSIQHKQSGKGELKIRYNSLDELDGILEHIK